MGLNFRSKITGNLDEAEVENDILFNIKERNYAYNLTLSTMHSIS